MKKLEKNNKEIVARDYFIVFVISVLTILLALYIRSFAIRYKLNVSNKSPFENNVQSVTINDLDYLIPATTDGILFVSYRGDAKIKNMEIKLYRYISRKNLKEMVIYLNVDEYLNDEEYIKLLKEKMPNITSKIKDAPLFIYIKDGEAIDAKNSKTKMINLDVFKSLVKEYGIE